MTTPEITADEMQEHPEVFPQAGTVDVLRPSDFADFDGRAKMFADWHARFTDGIMPSRGIDPESLGVYTSDTIPGVVLISVDAITHASSDHLLSQRETFFWGNRADSSLAGAPSKGNLFVQDTIPDSGYLELDGVEPGEDAHTPVREHVREALRNVFSGEGRQKFDDYLVSQARLAIDQVVTSERFDVADLATVLPQNSIGDMLNIAAGKRGWIKDLSQNLLLFQDEETRANAGDQMVGLFSLIGDFETTAGSGADPEAVDDAFMNFYRDLLQLNDKVAEEDKFSEAEIANMMLMLTAAGNETSRNAIALGVYALATHPEQRDKLAALDPESDEYDKVWSRTVDEVLRWGTPVTSFVRVAIEDTEINGFFIAKGTPVMLNFGAANRDPSVFENPDEFDIDRPNSNKHVAFGAVGKENRHRCLGERVARHQVKIMLQEILKAMPNIKLAEGAELKLADSTYVTSVKRLEVEAE